jgi:hypothetical protein
MHLTHKNRPTRWDKLAKRLKLVEKVGDTLGMASYLGGLPIHPRIAKAVGDFAAATYTISGKRSQTEQMFDMHDLLPQHMFIDSETGHLVTTRFDVDPPGNLHERISDYEKIHGRVPNKYLEWEDRLVDLDKKLYELHHGNLRKMGGEIIQTLLFDFLELSRLRDNVLGAITPEFLAEGGGPWRSEPSLPNLSVTGGRRHGKEDLRGPRREDGAGLPEDGVAVEEYAL